MPDAPEVTVSHADLDAALEKGAVEVEAAEETVTEEPEIPEPEEAISSEPDQVAEPEEEPEPVEEPEEEETELVEPDDHKERSKLGRRVSGLEQNINLLVDKIDQLVTAKAEPEVEDPDDDEPVFITNKQLRELVRKETKEEIVQTKAQDQAARTEYENAYVGHVRKLGGDLPPKQLDAIFKEMYENHNEVLNKGAETDAHLNFLNAKLALAEKSKPAPKVIPLKKDDPKNLGGPADTDIKPKVVAVQKLDKHAAAFAKYHNLSDEKVTAALSGETKPSLRGKFG